MHRIMIVRHAKSDWGDWSLADHDRPLAPRGIEALDRMRDHLAGGTAPELVLCSSARRTLDTMAGIQAAFTAAVDVRVEDGLYGATAHRLLERIREIDDDVATAALVGHNPGVHDLVLGLIDGNRTIPDRLALKFPTGAIATLAFDVSWGELARGSAHLDDFFTPRRM